MKHIKVFKLLEWDIVGDPTGSAVMMYQNPRIPDNISIKKYSDEWTKKPKKNRKKRIKSNK